ncbi:MAG: FRG domain-containing protein [Anaerolineae bacterium]
MIQGNITRAHDWNHLNELVFLNSWNEKLERYRSPYAFRGLANAAWGLETSLMRLNHSTSMTRDLERVILRHFKKYAYDQSSQNYSDWQWLALAQHHGLPTRLLDWTYSPFIAMHFATAELDKFDLDGAIWCIDRSLARDRYLPDDLRDIVYREYAISFTMDMLEDYAADLVEFDDKVDMDNQHTSMIFFDPPTLDSRIVNQSAFFSLLSSPVADLGEWLRERPDIWFKIIIPAELKWEIRDKLDQMNITERMLFPGLDGLSSWLKRYYSPRNPDEK